MQETIGPKIYTEWVQTTERVLNEPEFQSMGPQSRLEQEGPEFMLVKEVRKDAIQKKPALLENIVQEVGLDPNEEVKVNGESIIKKEGTTFKVLTKSLKSEVRSRDKTQNEYGGNAKYLCDVGRALIICNPIYTGGI